MSETSRLAVVGVAVVLGVCLILGAVIFVTVLVRGAGRYRMLRTPGFDNPGRLVARANERDGIRPPRSREEP